jgi:sugar phosphate isomerase/epimerase
MHPRVNLHQVAFGTESTTAFIDHCRAIDIANMTLATPHLMQPSGVEEAVLALAAGGPRVIVINHPFGFYPNLDEDGGQASEKLLQAIMIADRLGARLIYLVSGGRGRLSWEAASERFAALIAPCLPLAAAKDIMLTVETASPFTVDIHMAHTLDDTIRLAEIARIGVCIDLHACWFEGGLYEKFARAMPITGLVQVSDYIAGDRTTPCRAVIGDGIVPVERLLGAILEAGYQGVFDLELLGPRIVAEGSREATTRAAENLSEILVKLGA